MMEIRALNHDELEGYTYRGEGNANLVISLPKTRSVFRFRKIKTTEELANDGGIARIEYEYKFFHDITSKYLGKFVSKPLIVHCNPTNDIADWSERVEALRPEHRRDNIGYAEYGIILPDYTLLPLNLEGKTKVTKKPTFCIEIKPKQGFVPEADRLFQRCPYCINQFYKVSNGSIRQRSNYCPCDLFSGDTSRVKRSIKSLLESPQNNFIIFKNGERVWCDGYDHMDLEHLLVEWFSNDSTVTTTSRTTIHNSTQRLIEDLSYLISEALLQKFPVGEDDPTLSNPIKEYQVVVPVQLDKHHHHHLHYQQRQQYSRLDLETIRKAKNNLKRLNKTCEFSNGKLPQGSALNRIFFMQQLHCINTDVVYAIYSSYSHVLNEQMVYFTKSDDDKNDCNINLANDECNYNTSDLNYEQIKIIRNYLLFSVARDCSLLIAFREIDFDCIEDISRNHVIMLSQRRRCFSFNIGITDVDPKNLNRIEKHRQHTIRALNSVALVDCDDQSKIS